MRACDVLLSDGRAVPSASVAHLRRRVGRSTRCGEVLLIVAGESIKSVKFLLNIGQVFISVNAEWAIFTRKTDRHLKLGNLLVNVIADSTVPDIDH